MSFTFEKDDPSLFNVLPIRWDEDPVRSLSTINLNFDNLDTELCNISFSANNFWNELYTDFTANSGKWDSVFTTVQTYSAYWQSTYTTVSETSAAWLSPVTVIFPNPISSLNRPAMLEWLQINFPAKTGSCVNYLNGQIMNVFALEYTIAFQKQTVRCGTRGGVVGCQCRAETIKLNDRYTRAIRGLKYRVVGYTWEYVEDLY